MSTQFSGTVIRDSIARVDAVWDEMLQICGNCGQTQGLHSHEGLHCPSPWEDGPFYTGEIFVKRGNQ